MIERDILLVGGGLANGLIAFRLGALRPDLRVALIDHRPLGDGRTWSFHDTDLSDDQRAWLSPFVAHRWSSQEVRFPSLHRRLASGYATISGERFRDVLESQASLGLIRAEAMSVTAHRVDTADGQILTAPLVVDGRGHRPAAALHCGWQKFLGLELALKAPSGLQHPILMDATVPQSDGFRFVYSLPLDERRMLVEDTFYSASPRIDEAASHRLLLDYAEDAGWSVEEVVRSESGALPIPLAGDIDRFWRQGNDPPARSGMAAGLFHMVTGYSLPDAVRLADALAGLDPLSTATVAAFVEKRSRRHWRRQAFYRMLNRMLFQAAEPEARWRVMERFYRLPEALIERFYAGATTPTDKLRILLGRPPVPIGRALACIAERGPADAGGMIGGRPAWRDE